MYLLSTIYRNSELATNGGLTYFLLGALSSCFILFGISLIYANSGTTNLDGLYIITSLSDLSNGFETNNVSSYWYKSDYINYSLLILSVGFLFKISAAPFHFWSPLVYDAIPTIVTTFVAIIAKISILIFLLELVYYTSNSLFKDMEYTWTTSLLVSSFISLIIGSILGLREKRIKRLLAYSSISHLGFLLLALSINSIESIYAFIFYLLQYSISNLNVFIILISIGYSFYSYVNNSDNYKQLKDKNNSPIQLISQLKGYFNINPLLSLSLAITIFSFVGVPPLIGFFAKQMVLSAALDSGYVFLGLIAILTSVISAVYYLNIIKEVFFSSASKGQGVKEEDKSRNGLEPERRNSEQALPLLDPLLWNLQSDKSCDSDSLSIDATTSVNGVYGGGREAGWGQLGASQVGSSPSSLSKGQEPARGKATASLRGLGDTLNEKFQYGAKGQGGSKFEYNFSKNIILSSYLTITISILTLLILLFICFSVNLLDLVNILSLSFL